MAEYTSERLGASFKLPDKIRVRQHLQYREAIWRAAADKLDVYSQFWQGGLSLIEGWKCDGIDDPASLDLDTETDIHAADVVMWASDTIAGHMAGLRSIEKND